MFYVWRSSIMNTVSFGRAWRTPWGGVSWPNATGCHCQMWRHASINYLEAHPRALSRPKPRTKRKRVNGQWTTDNGNGQCPRDNWQQLVTGNWKLATCNWQRATVHYAITAWMRHSWPSFQSQAITVTLRKRQLTKVANTRRRHTHTHTHWLTGSQSSLPKRKRGKERKPRKESRTLNAGQLPAMQNNHICIINNTNLIKSVYGK